MNAEEMKELLQCGAELGIARYLSEVEPARDRITQSEAYRQFGETRVKYLKRRGLITCRRAGVHINSPFYYSKADILAAIRAKDISAKAML
jgi:hypothetical protein